MFLEKTFFEGLGSKRTGSESFLFDQTGQIFKSVLKEQHKKLCVKFGDVIGTKRSTRLLSFLTIFLFPKISLELNFKINKSCHF